MNGRAWRKRAKGLAKKRSIRNQEENPIPDFGPFTRDGLRTRFDPVDTQNACTVSQRIQYTNTILYKYITRITQILPKVRLISLSSALVACQESCTRRRRSDLKFFFLNYSSLLDICEPVYSARPPWVLQLV